MTWHNVYDTWYDVMYMIHDMTYTTDKIHIYSMNYMIDKVEQLWTDLFEWLERMNVLWWLTWMRRIHVYVVYSWMIKMFVYVMFYLNSRDTCIGMTYTNDRDIRLGNELYERQR